MRLSDAGRGHRANDDGGVRESDGIRVNNNSFVLNGGIESIGEEDPV